MLDKKYNHKESEAKWQQYWRQQKVHQWQDDKPKSETFVIDTPPPTVSGVLHMGHVFSYTQADFVARYQRMIGKDVFYPMGYDDNGLPTERLVEKVKKIRANQMPREEFIKQCQEIVDEAEEEFEALFNSIALSVDWEQKYQTISKKSQSLSQSSFVDLHQKGLVERKFAPVIWDCVDQTALSQADLEDKEVSSKMNYLNFEDEKGDEIEIMTTRPELLPACVALIINASHEEEDGSKKWQKYLDQNQIDENNQGFTGYYAYSAVFGVKVPIIADNNVKTDKGTGAVMCCTFGDETDVNWARDHNLPLRCMVTKYGKLCNLEKGNSDQLSFFYEARDKYIQTSSPDGAITSDVNSKNYCKDIEKFITVYEEVLQGKKIKQAREDFIQYLADNNLLARESEATEQNVKCAERSGSLIEFITQDQWYIKITQFKEELIAQINKCNWHPDFMKVRAIQWCEKLSQDWCISRQRYFGVPFPVWHVNKDQKDSDKIVANFHELPIDPCDTSCEESKAKIKAIIEKRGYNITDINEKGEITATMNGKDFVITPETDIMDTWATSSISPQLSSGLVSSEMLDDLLKSGKITEQEKEEIESRHNKLFPADLRPQAHEIIRTWAFYTICKAFLHNFDKDQKQKPTSKDHDQSIPWEGAMISGWCLAADKTKMSKSKGNVVTPTNLITEKGSDIVRYWTSTSNLGADTAYSEDVFKIGQKLSTKLFNAAKFTAINFTEVDNHNFPDFSLASQDGDQDYQAFFTKITQSADRWVISKLQKTIKDASLQFDKFEYAKARTAIEEFFWNDFCDNYLEIAKVRSYGATGLKYENIELNEQQKHKIQNEQISAILTLKLVLNNLLKLFAPFMPHICEELYSNLYHNEFEAKKSVNARGNWPSHEKLIFDENNVTIGEEVKKIIAEVRKYKSDNNLSMKSEIAKLEISTETDIAEAVEDLKNVTNSLNVSLNKGLFDCKIITN